MTLKNMTLKTRFHSAQYALLLLIVTAVLWSMGGLLIKSVHLPPLVIAGVRSLIATLFLLVIRPRGKFDFSWYALAGGATNSLTMILFVCANKLTTAANAILLQYTAPIFAALFGVWFLREPVRRRDLVCMFFVFSGLTLFFLDNLSTTGMVGNILAILSGVAFAWNALFVRKIVDRPLIDVFIIGNALTAIVCAPWVVQTPPDLHALLIIGFMGVFQIGLPYLLYSLAMKHVRAVEALLVVTLEPILNPVWVFLFLGEQPGLWALIGGIIVVTAITARGVSTSKYTSDG